MAVLEQRLSLVTLGVEDVRRSTHFYRDILGWTTSATDDDPIAFFPLHGIVLGIYQREALAEDAQTDATGSGFRGFTLAHNVRDKPSVDAVFEQLSKAGCRIVKPPRTAEWGGYSGYFADPDGYLWEVAYNPGWKLTAKGDVRL